MTREWVIAVAAIIVLPIAFGALLAYFRANAERRKDE